MTSGIRTAVHKAPDEKVISSIEVVYRKQIALRRIFENGQNLTHRFMISSNCICKIILFVDLTVSDSECFYSEK